MKMFSYMLILVGIIGTACGEIYCAGLIVLGICNLKKKRVAMTLVALILLGLTITTFLEGGQQMYGILYAVLTFFQLKATAKNWKKMSRTTETK